MTYRRRNRWTRRLVVGLAFATFAAPAAAQLDEGGASRAGYRTVTAGGWTGLVDAAGIPLSAGIPTGDEPYVSTAVVDPYLTDVFVRPGEAQAGPDGGPPLGAAAVRQAPVRKAAQSSDEGWTPTRADAVAFGLGGLALALALGLAVGYAKRPHIAGL
jgi:hypothetical protein